jgi:predicted acylesterase/phospholipase RssA
MTASCVDVNTGNYHLMNETSEDIVKVVVSSGSMPAAFPP